MLDKVKISIPPVSKGSLISVPQGYTVQETGKAAAETVPFSVERGTCIS